MSSLGAGVSPVRKKDGSLYYRSSVTFKNKHISLGGFDDPGAAHLAYKEAKRILSDKKCAILSYSEDSALPFEKWVSLINFRDNGIYISNPIYIMRRMFLYYLSPADVLKFDAEELFFYSSHKIMRRGSHLFVADYGLQLNILNRYGIRSHSVPGRDHIFENGDASDFRSSNIRIINRYTGVVCSVKKKASPYKSVIHIRGNFVIGYYESETEAAIAYNKAADILISHGLDKEYARNYIDGLSAEEYRRIYDSLKISEKITGLVFS